MLSTPSPVFSPDLSLDKLPPHNTDAEIAVLGGILLQEEAISIIAEKLPVNAFYWECHQHIYRAALNLYKQQIPVTLISVTEYLEKNQLLKDIGPRNKLASIVGHTVSAVNIDAMANLLLEKYTRRRVIELGREITMNGYNDFEFQTVADLLRKIEDNTLSLTKSSNFSDPKDGIDKWNYGKLIQLINDIESKISDPGYKLWKLQALAKEHRKSPKELEQIYLKSLADFSNQPLKGLSELVEECATEDREWLLYGFLPKATTILLHAEGGVGKTKLVYELAYNLAMGKSWSGYPATGTNKILCYQTDESPHDMRQALQARGFFNENMAENFRYRTSWVIDAIPQLIQDIEEFRPNFILIDSLTSVSRYSIFEENSTEYARPLLQLVQVAAKYNCTILVVHHSNAEGRSRGTRAIRNSVSEVWHLKEDNTKTADGLERILEIEKSRSRSKAQYRLRFDPENYSWHCLGKEGEDLSEQTTKDKIIEFLSRNRNVGYQSEEIAHEIGATSGHVRKCLNTLKQDGAISRKEKGEKGELLGYKQKPYLYFIAGDDVLSNVNADPRSNELKITETPEFCINKPQDHQVLHEISMVSASSDPGHTNFSDFSGEVLEDSLQKNESLGSQTTEALCNKEIILIQPIESTKCADKDHENNQPDHKNNQPEHDTANPPFTVTVQGKLGTSTATIRLVKARKKYLKVAVEYAFANGDTVVEEAHPVNRREAEVIVRNRIDQWQKEALLEQFLSFRVRQMGEEEYFWVEGCKLVSLPNPPVSTWYVFESLQGDRLRVVGDSDFEVEI